MRNKSRTTATMECRDNAFLQRQETPMASAARTNDLHICPLCDGPKPHVGGMILQGIAKVLIGGQPAAVKGTECKCASPAKNQIASGSSKVMIGGKAAA